MATNTPGARQPDGVAPTVALQTAITYWQCHECTAFNAILPHEENYWAQRRLQPCRNPRNLAPHNRCGACYDLACDALGQWRISRHCDGSAIPNEEYLRWYLRGGWFFL